MTEDKLDGRFRFYETGVFHTIEPLKMAAALAAVLLTGIFLLCCFLTAMDDYQNSIVDELHSSYSQIGNIFVSSLAKPVITVIWLALTLFIGFIVASALFDRKWKYIATEDNITFSSKRKTVIYKYENVINVSFRDYKLLHRVIGLVVTVNIETRVDKFKYVYPDSMIPKNEMNTPFAIINKKKLEKLKAKRLPSEEKTAPAEKPVIADDSYISPYSGNYENKVFGTESSDTMDSISADNIDFTPSRFGTDEDRSMYFAKEAKAELGSDAPIIKSSTDITAEPNEAKQSDDGDDFDYNSLFN